MGVMKKHELFLQVRRSGRVKQQRIEKMKYVSIPAKADREPLKLISKLGNVIFTHTEYFNY